MQKRPSRTFPSARLLRGLQYISALAGVAVFAVVGSVSAVRRTEDPEPVPSTVSTSATQPGTGSLGSRAEAAPLSLLPVPDPAGDRPPPAPLVVSEGVIAPGDSLAHSLAECGVSPDVVQLIAREMSPHFDFRRSQPGHGYRLVRDEEGRLVDFRYRTSPLESYHLLRDGQGYVVRKEDAEFTPHVARLAGVVTSNLYRAVRDLGEDPQLASDLADIFAWDIDFSRSVRPGDEFRILYHRLYREGDDGTEVYLRPGRILAARYEGAIGAFAAVYFEEEEGRGGYYRPSGNALERQFLLAPLRSARITSRFSSARLHPILKVTRPHYGVDYAAPTGTPVWSVADGKVVYRGWAGGFGNLVKIRHAKGYVSYYAHLSRFAGDLREGDTVRQKQVIGYVGKTGLATGPHVCFRVTKNGRYVNPRHIRTPAGDPVSPAVQHLFQAVRDTLLAELDAGPVIATDGAL